MSAALVLFAKSPVPGRVKTRLTTVLSAEQAAEFHWACVCDAWAKIEQVDGASRYFYSDNPGGNGESLVGPNHRKVQHGADLGERMLNCFKELRERGHNRILIAGSDSPTLPAEYFPRGLNALEKVDAVLGPSEDGGYYAIGCREPHPRMFAAVPWSAGDTLRQTESSLNSLGRSIYKLPLWYDVDTVEDLRRLASEDSLPPNVARWMAANRSLLA